MSGIKKLLEIYGEEQGSEVIKIMEFMQEWSSEFGINIVAFMLPSGVVHKDLGVAVSTNMIKENTDTEAFKQKIHIKNAILEYYVSLNKVVDKFSLKNIQEEKVVEEKELKKQAIDGLRKNFNLL